MHIPGGCSIFGFSKGQSAGSSHDKTGAGSREARIRSQKSRVRSQESFCRLAHFLACRVSQEALAAFCLPPSGFRLLSFAIYLLPPALWFLPTAFPDLSGLAKDARSLLPSAFCLLPSTACFLLSTFRVLPAACASFSISSLSRLGPQTKGITAGLPKAGTLCLMFLRKFLPVGNGSAGTPISERVAGEIRETAGQPVRRRAMMLCRYRRLGILGVSNQAKQFSSGGFMARRVQV
jgi:hypothetical protein